MHLFGLQASDSPTASGEDIALQEAQGSSESLGDVTRRIVARFHHVDTELDLSKLQARFNQAVSDVTVIVKDQVARIHDGIVVDTVDVELGITVGGEIGLFAKGRVDIAASFSVTFKVQHQMGT